MTSGSIGGEMKAKKEAGRPSKYKVEYNKKVLDYLEKNKDSEKMMVSGGSKLTVKLPTIEGFAVYIGVNKTSLFEWKKLYPIFSNSLELIKSEQMKRLLNSGLSGDYNSTIAKLILSSNHGMREKTEIEHDIKDGFYERFSGVSTEDLKKQTKKLIDDEE